MHAHWPLKLESAWASKVIRPKNRNNKSSQKPSVSLSDGRQKPEGQCKASSMILTPWRYRSDLCRPTQLMTKVPPFIRMPVAVRQRQAVVAGSVSSADDNLAWNQMIQDVCTTNIVSPLSVKGEGSSVQECMSGMTCNRIEWIDRIQGTRYQLCTTSEWYKYPL